MKTLIAPEILLPNTTDMSAWSVIACDQFTSEHDYWNELYSYVGDKLSTLNLTLPEIYLEDNAEARIKTINENISKYVKNGVFRKLAKGFILTIRKTPFVQRRIGLIGAIDLEDYEYSQKSSALVRATEGTIAERIPPRLKIRENVEIEFPHIMVLFDDENKAITEKLYENRANLEKVYDFDLNMGGGHIEGYVVSDYQSVIDQFNSLLDSERLINKYGSEDKFLFAVGDGNHSLATAKEHWNKIKANLTDIEIETHPARYALVELVNIYDDGIYFEPIYRYIKGVDVKKFLDGFSKVDAGKIRIYANGKETIVNGKNTLPEGIKETDKYVKEYIDSNGGFVDYVHGESNIKKLIDENEGAVGILFEKLDKQDLFKYVSNKGAFPRKTFSMGEGVEKRYYLEGKYIKK